MMTNTMPTTPAAAASGAASGQLPSGLPPPPRPPSAGAARPSRPSSAQAQEEIHRLRAEVAALNQRLLDADSAGLTTGPSLNLVLNLIESIVHRLCCVKLFELNVLNGLGLWLGALHMNLKQKLSVEIWNRTQDFNTLSPWKWLFL